MRHFHSGDYSGRNPDWYWKLGLHDAEILRSEQLEYPYDWKERNPVRNCLSIYLKASGALFDTGVKAIHLQNYKILRDDSHLGGYEDGKLDGCYWMQDILTYENDAYILEITALGEDDFKVTIRFENAIVDR